MYKPIDKLQHSFLDFNQPLGLHMNPDNRWIKLADRIPWDTFEAKYAELFPSDTGNVAKPLRMALGALIIQTKFQYSDRELVEQIAENPYLQYFIGLPGFREEAPEHDLAREEFTEKYGMFGEMLKTEEEIAREKRKHTHRLYTMSDVPEYVEISEKWLAAENELREYRDRCLKQGMELMMKYFRNLWD